MDKNEDWPGRRVDWICPACGHKQTDYLSKTYGPSYEVLCENCDKWTPISEIGA